MRLARRGRWCAHNAMPLPSWSCHPTRPWLIASGRGRVLHKPKVLFLMECVIPEKRVAPHQNAVQKSEYARFFLLRSIRYESVLFLRRALSSAD